MVESNQYSQLSLGLGRSKQTWGDFVSGFSPSVISGVTDVNMSKSHVRADSNKVGTELL